MAAHQALPSLGFSRQEHWSRLPFPSPVHESEKWKEVTQSCLTFRDLMDCNLPGSPIHGIFQARVLEWGAIAFSNVRLNTAKFLEEITGRTHFDINHSRSFWICLLDLFLFYGNRTKDLKKKKKKKDVFKVLLLTHLEFHLLSQEQGICMNFNSPLSGFLVWFLK